MYFDKVYKSLVIMYLMPFKVVAGAGIGTETSFDGEDLNKLSRVLNGTPELGDPTITFGSTVTFKDGFLLLRDPSNTNSLTIRPIELSNDGTLYIPNITSDTIAVLTAPQTLTNKTLTAPKILGGGFIADGSGNEIIEVDQVSFAVNHIKVTNAISGADPIISSKGESDHVGLKLQGKGNGKVTIMDGTLDGTDGTKKLDFDTSLQNASTTCTLSTGSTTGTRTVTLPSTTSTLAISSAAQTFTGTQTFSSLIKANGGISLGTGDRIKADTTGNEIGIYVRNEAVTIGNEGTLQVPQLVQSAAPNTDDLNAAFGIVQGSIGLWRNTTTPTSNRIYLRTSAGTWHYLTLIPSSI